MHPSARGLCPDFVPKRVTNRLSRLSVSAIAVLRNHTSNLTRESAAGERDELAVEHKPRRKRRELGQQHRHVAAAPGTHAEPVDR